MEEYCCIIDPSEVKFMQNIINAIKESNNSDDVKNILKPLSKKNVIQIANDLDVKIRGNENKTEVISNIILEIIKGE